MPGDLPDYYFRIRDNGATVFRVDTENRQRRMELEEIAVVNLDRLAKLRKDEIGPKEMAEHRLIGKATDRVKVLGRGDLASAKTVRAHEFSASAVKKIEAKGGQAVVIGKGQC